VGHIAQRLAGEYEVLEFQTEGTETPQLRRWRLSLVPTDDSVRRAGGGRFGLAGQDRQVIAAGARGRLGAADDRARAAAGRLLGPNAVVADYTTDARGGARVQLIRAVPINSEGGGSTFYAVHAAEDSVVGGGRAAASGPSGSAEAGRGRSSPSADSFVRAACAGPIVGERVPNESLQLTWARIAART
jgi:hypothetical protein